jgi:thiol-disulfide isomerase/thioredoxin
MQKLRFLLFIFIFHPLTSFASLELGQPAPNIIGTLVNNKKFSLPDNKGKVILVNFWASWCEPCREEMPAIQAFLDKNREKGLEVLAITMDKPSDMAQAKKIMDQYSFLFAEKKQIDYSEYGRIWRIPSTFIIDRQGILRKNGLSGDPKIDTKTLEQVVTPLLLTQ